MAEKIPQFNTQGRYNRVIAELIGTQGGYFAEAEIIGRKEDGNGPKPDQRKGPDQDTHPGRYRQPSGEVFLLRIFKDFMGWKIEMFSKPSLEGMNLLWAGEGRLS